MLDNKGFAVSSVLYTLLISFLMFLGATLAIFSSSSTLIGKANDDLINGTQFKVTQVKPVLEGTCGSDYQWYESNIVVQVKSRYGTKYWPKDFAGNNISVNNTDLTSGLSSGKISVSYNSSPDDVEYENFGELTFTDEANQDKKSIILVDICE